ncbi:hypothetical protein GCM10010329_81830 [Streptomyces spiroverticillatus]|uniref:Secreted protein n=1 Tax=Streptomyces finlayi TaxID=67296 RepID=A0A919CFR6_9ACTN|nr:hypothetical protein GCM10010329_81830 [Streptomyces spiroverticillatus]GHD18268.1 hypothetical protein GCM10010334_80910 [Streptomyces finlayi]
MRKFGQTVALAALTAAALLPLAGTASAATAEPSAKPAAVDRCWVHYGKVVCTDDPRWYPHYSGVGVGLGLGLGIGVL